MKGFRKVLGIGVVVVVGVIVLAAILGDDDSNAPAGNGGSVDVSAESTAPLGVGDTGSARRFDITLNEAYLTDFIDVGNEFLNESADEGNLFVVIDATWENTDDQSRTVFAGDLAFYDGEKRYEVNTTETIMADGWGVLLDQVSPMSRFTAKIVYQIPNRPGLNVWWEPASDVRFAIGQVPAE